jgi:hypothetical protein
MLIGGVCASLMACVSPPPPYEDYTIARTAIRAAQEVDSARFAAGWWAKAEENYRKAEIAYREVDFEEAKKFFKNATKYAERAEDATRMKKFESGDSFP